MSDKRVTECMHERVRHVQDRILIRVAEGETSSSGGVILTSQSAEKPTIGEVVAVGPGKKDEKTGQVVAVNCKAGEQVRLCEHATHHLHVTRRWKTHFHVLLCSCERSPGASADC